jgi:O-antigen/teichoic acid export membrane protein
MLVELTDVRPSFASSALVTYVAQMAVAFFSLLNVLIVARGLGATGRGDVAFLVAVAYLTSQFASGGVQQAIANIAASRPETRPALATNACLFAAGYGFAAAGILVIAIKLVPDIGGDQHRGLLILAIATIPVLILSNYLLLMTQAEYRFRASNAAWVVPPIVNAALNGILSVAGVLTPSRAFMTWVLGQVIALILLLVSVQRRSGFGRPDRALARESAQFGIQAHFGRVMLLGNYRVDQWILGAISDTRELGIYSVAVSWAEVLFFIPTVLMMVQRPDVSRADKEDAAGAASAVFRAGVLCTIPVAVFLLVAAPFLCVTLLGSDFAGSVSQMRVLTFGAFGIVALKILGGTLTAQRRPNLETLAIGGAFVTTIALDVLLIPAHGGMGAAVASTAAYTAGGILVMVIFVRALGVSPGRLMPRSSDPRWIATTVLRRGRA